jgi:tetratricopeptide (TPR) repeat protein
MKGEPEKNRHNKNAEFKFQTLEAARKRRNNMVGYGKRALIAVAICVIIAGGIFVILSFNNTQPSDLANTADNTISSHQKAIDCETITVSPADTEHLCNLKGRFHEIYRIFTTKHLPDLESSSKEGFVQIELTKIQEIESNAIAAFDKSDFTTAITFIETAINAAKVLKTNINKTFQETYFNASQAFQYNDYQTAKGYIETSLRLNPSDANSATLQERIAVLPDVLKLYQKVAEAEVQNQLLDKFRYMEKILALDPMRQDIASELQVLGKEIKEIQYDNFLRQAGGFIDNDELDRARNTLANANSLFPNRQDSTALLQKIASIEQQRLITRLLNDAKFAETNDDWPTAMHNYDQVLTEDSTNQIAENGREKANRIIQANNRGVDMLNRQSRMQDTRIHQHIVEFVEQIKPLATDSPTLGATITSLKETLLLWAQTRKVTVLSDGKSEIKVRRVGNVGKIKSKDINLKPGNYEFECTRKGYRSNIVKHHIPPQGKVGSVTIICDIPV